MAIKIPGLSSAQNPLTGFELLLNDNLFGSFTQTATGIPLYGARLATAGELQVAFEAPIVTAPRTDLADLYAVTVTGTAALMLDSSLNPNVKTDTFMHYDGAGIPTGHGGIMPRSGVDISDLSRSVGMVGGMTWEAPGAKVITAVTFGVVAGELVYATATLNRTIADSYDVPEDRTYVISPGGNTANVPAGATIMTRWDGQLPGNPLETELINVLFENGVTHSTLGAELRSNRQQQVAIASYDPNNYSDRSGRISLIPDETNGLVQNIISGVSTGPAGSSISFARPTYVGNYDPLTGTGDASNLLSSTGAEDVTVHDARASGHAILSLCQGDTRVQGVTCAHGTSWQNYGILFGKSRHLLTFGVYAKQPDGTYGDQLKGQGTRPDHSAIRFQATGEDARISCRQGECHALNGWGGTTDLDGDGIGEAPVQSSHRILHSGVEAGNPLKDDYNFSNHRVSFTQNICYGGAGTTGATVSSDDEEAHPGELLWSHNYFEADGWTTSWARFSYGNTVFKSNVCYSVNVTKKWLNALERGIEFGRDKATHRYGNELLPCYAFDNTFYSDQDVSDMTSAGGHKDFVPVYSDGILSFSEAGNVSYAPGAANGSIYDFLPLDANLRPQVGSSAYQSRVAGDLVSLFDAAMNARPLAGASQGALEPA